MRAILSFNYKQKNTFKEYNTTMSFKFERRLMEFSQKI